MKIIKIHPRITKKKENLKIPIDNHENNENYWIPNENHENHEKIFEFQRESLKSIKNRRIPQENHEPRKS